MVETTGSEGEVRCFTMQKLKNTSINITCYDRNGNIVKRITSTDEGNVEDPENPTPGGGDENEGPDII